MSTTSPNPTANLQAAILFNALPIGTILPWKQSAGQDVPDGWEVCDATAKVAPNLTNLFLRGNGSTPTGTVGGSDTATVPIAGSNNAAPNGDGWSKDGSHYVGNVTITTVARHYAVVFIMKISNFQF